MITDLERIGDQAADIAEITISFCAVQGTELNFEIVEKMGHKTIEMVKKSIQAFREGDMALADEVIMMDDQVDEYFDIIRNRVIDRIRTDGLNDPGKFVDILMIAKYLERIGDHAQNVAEWVVYSITGQHEAHPDEPQV